jgi:hypothetical protein
VTELLSDTWTNRDFRLLRHVAAEIDASADGTVSTRMLPQLTSMTQADVTSALRALDGEYVTINWFMRAVGFGMIQGITPTARRAVGMWPTAESVTEQLLATIDEQIETSDGDKRSKLIKMRDALGGAARDIFVDVMASVVTRSVVGG